MCILCLCLHNVSLALTGLVREFDILDDNTSTQGMPFDYQSVMHIGFLASAKRRTRTIVPLKISGHISITTYPTALDMFHLKIMYCAGNTCISLIK